VCVCVCVCVCACAVVPNICGTSIWNLFHVILLVSWNFEMAAGFLENMCTIDLANSLAN